jgi:hypothetical protein
VWSDVLRGAAAGAAGTAALNATTYLDMAVRGRPASRTPEQSVEILADKAHLRIPGLGGTRSNRLTGLGGLFGIVTGVAIGAAYGALHHTGLVRRTDIGMVVIAGGAMAVTDLPMAALGVCDPRTWSVGSWLSDAVPHLVYGAVTAATMTALVRSHGHR